MLQEEGPIRFSKIMSTALITMYLGFSAAINLSGALAPLKSFIQRFLQWTELLDPTNLVVSIEKIEKSRQLLLTHEDASGSDLEDKRVQEAWKRSLSTVHPDSSKLIPGPFRPAALLPFTAPMVFLSMLPVKSLKSMILPQVSFYTYSTVFNIVNGNASYDRRPHESILVGAGVIASSTFFGLFPRLFQVRFSLNSILSRNVIPVVILAQLSGMNVVASRSLEPLRGIEVMDKEGSVIGYSRKAGTKAVKDTATSRVVLFGTSAFIPEVFSYFFKRTQFFLQCPWSLWTLKLSCTILVMGLMVPVSFSVFPQIGRIQCSELEKEIQSATEETELFYNRGV
ncbi:sideroflexin-4 isoform X1 [Tursiops truncatus]|uniref:Sideroflexin-4 isoform X1 n=1 Tax=Tursiops truncatus TaxID=9739 RepID=A0A2U4BR12_TURTR|nr:sideroflexin-4 isoform X1 [Tursiops truncatus]